MEEQSLETLERQKLLLLLPFCLVRFHRELGKAAAEERLAVAKKQTRTLEDLARIVTRTLDSGFLGSGDGMWKAYLPKKKPNPKIRRNRYLGASPRSPLTNYATYFLKTTTPLCPPNPSEPEATALISPNCALFAT